MAEPSTGLAEQQRARLAVDGLASPGGGFEILAITAGEGNGWDFSEPVLRDSLALWAGAECFVDHAWAGHSLRDLAGVLSAPTWDPAARGVRCTLRPVGPSGPLLAELGRQLCAEPGPTAPRVGFSADVIFTAQGRAVEQILHVLSVDLVYNPARGGAFVRALNSRAVPIPFQPQSRLHGAINPMETLTQPPAGSPSAENEPGIMPAADPVRELRAEMCACLLESALANAGLPAPAAERVRAQFAGRVFAPAELTQSLADARQLVADLTAPQSVRGTQRAGLERIHGMVSSEDQFSAALYDLLGAQRPDPLTGVRTAKLSGIRELYTLMTGDVDFAGGYDAARARFATSADLPGVLKNAMNKLILQEWQELGRSGYRWWEPVVSVEHFNSLQSITGILVGEVTVLPAVAEGEAYTALGISDSAEVGEWSKYGGYIGLTLEMFERDETHKLRQYPRKLASASLRRISALVGSVFTANAGAGPAMTDTYNVFDATHHANLGTTALSAAAWESASQAIYKQTMLTGGGTAPRQAVDARYLLVPRGLRLTGWQILYPSFAHEANIFSENLQKGEQGDVITVPEFSDATDWAAVADPRLAPAIILGERFGLQPEIILAGDPSQGALFSNDELRMKVRHWVSVFVADYRGLYKANVA